MDFYSSDLHKKQLIQKGFEELLYKLLEKYNQFIYNFYDYFLNKGLIITDEYFGITNECLQQFKEDEIMNIYPRVPISNYQEKKEYLIKIVDYVDLYEELDNLNVNKDRHRELCGIVYEWGQKEHMLKKKYIKTFMHNQLFDGSKGFSNVLDLTEHILLHIYTYYSDQLYKPFTKGFKIPSSFVNFKYGIDKRIEIIEKIFGE